MACANAHGTPASCRARCTPYELGAGSKRGQTRKQAHSKKPARASNVQLLSGRDKDAARRVNFNLACQKSTELTTKAVKIAGDQPTQVATAGKRGLMDLTRGGNFVGGSSERNIAIRHGPAVNLDATGTLQRIRIEPSCTRQKSLMLPHPPADLHSTQTSNPSQKTHREDDFALKACHVVCWQGLHEHSSKQTTTRRPGAGQRNPSSRTAWNVPRTTKATNRSSSI